MVERAEESIEANLRVVIRGLFYQLSNEVDDHHNLVNTDLRLLARKVHQEAGQTLGSCGSVQDMSLLQMVVDALDSTRNPSLQQLANEMKTELVHCGGTLKTALEEMQESTDETTLDADVEPAGSQSPDSTAKARPSSVERTKINPK